MQMLEMKLINPDKCTNSDAQLTNCFENVVFNTKSEKFEKICITELATKYLFSPKSINCI